MSNRIVLEVGGEIFLGKNGEYKKVTGMYGVWDWAGTYSPKLTDVRRLFKTEKAAARFAVQIGGFSKLVDRAER